MAKKRVNALLTIRVSLVPGICRWCRCTYERPCANGCGWADRMQTLCTECVPLDHAMETAAGRQAIADHLQESEYLGLVGTTVRRLPKVGTDHLPKVRKTRR